MEIKEFWVDSESYFYGEIVKIGGRRRAYIHLATDRYGVLAIETPKDFLKDYKGNLLYKTFGINTKYKQHYPTFKIDKSRLKFVELIDYDPTWDEEYLDNLIKKATKNWAKIEDKDTWLRMIRGYEDYEE